MPQTHSPRRASRARRLPSAILSAGAAFALLPAGCDARSESAPTGVEALPEAGVEEEVAIGHPDDPDFAFTAVSGIVVGPDGTIWTKHQQEAVLRRWSAEGVPLGVVGRRGEGPGEFTTPSAMGTVGPPPGDSIWVHDRQLARFTFLDWDGAVRASRPAPFDMGTREQTVAGALPPRPQGLFLDGWVHASPPLISDAVARGLIEGADHVAQDPAGGEAEPVVRVPVGTTGTLALLFDDGGTFTSQPFGDAAIASRSADGSAFVLMDRTAASEPGEATFRVTRIAAVPRDEGVGRGDTLFHVEVPYQAQAIPEWEVEVRVEALRESLYGFVGARTGLSEAAFGRRVSDALYRPAARPPVGAVLAGRDGSTWIRMNEAPDPPAGEEEDDPVPPRGQRWIVLDEGGEPVRAVRLPPRTRPLFVEQDRFWGVRTDELGVEYIVRYRVLPE